jgi:hypothetical protein
VNVTCFYFAIGKSSSISNPYAESSGSGLGSLTNRRVENFGVGFQHQENVQVGSHDAFLSTKLPDSEQVETFRATNYLATRKS